MAASFFLCSVHSLEYTTWLPCGLGELCVKNLSDAKLAKVAEIHCLASLTQEAVRQNLRRSHYRTA